MMAVDDVVAPEVGDHAEADGVTLDLKLHRNAGHLDAPDNFPCRQFRWHMEAGRQHWRTNTAFLQTIGYLPGLFAGVTAMRMKRFNCS